MRIGTTTSRRALLGALTVVVATTSFAGLANAAPAIDRNHDRIPDRWERIHHLPLRVQQTFLNQDRDELFNLFEYMAKTNPRMSDTDGDGIRDGLENPDGDSLANGEEQYLKTHPLKADSDGNGVEDGAEDFDNDGVSNHDEFVNGTDPLSQCEGDIDLAKGLKEERMRAFAFRKVATWFPVADYFDGKVDSDCDESSDTSDEDGDSGDEETGDRP